MAEKNSESLPANGLPLGVLVNQMDIGIAQTDLRGRFILVNDRYCETVGYPREELLGKNLQEITHPNDLASNLELFQKCVAEGEPFTIEKRYLRKDGAEVWVRNNVSLLRDADGRPQSVIAVSTDITKEKHAQSALEKSDERYRAFITQSSEAIWRFELDQPIRVSLPPDEQVEKFYRHAYLAECNDAMAEMYGYDSCDEIVGMRLGNFLPPEDAANIEYLRAFIASGYRLENAESHELDRHGRQKFFLNNLVGVVENGFLLRAWGTQRDITASKEIENELLESRAMLELTMRSSRMGSWSREATTGETWWSDELEEIFGLPRGGFAGTESAFYDLIHEDDRERVWSETEKAIAAKREYAVEFRFHHASGSTRWMEWRGQAVYSEKGEAIRLYGVGIDITERKQSEEALRESEERLRLATETAQMYSWEFDIRTQKGKMAANAAQVLGISPEFMPKTVEEARAMIHPEDRKAAIETSEQAIRGDGHYHDEFRLVHPETGKIIWVEAQGTVIRNEAGDPARFVGVTQNITERRQAEERLTLLAEISELTRKIEDPNELPFAVSKAVGEHLEVRRCLFNEIDLERDCETVHRDYCRGVESVAGTHKISVYSPITSAEMAVGKTVVNEDSKTDPRTARDYERAYKPNGERAYVAVPLLRDGCWVASLWVSDDRPRRWTKEEVSLLETVAERTWTAIEKLRIDAALRESEERFSKAFKASPLVLTISSLTDGALVEVNETFVRATGYTREEAIGKTTLELGLWKKPEDREEEMEAVRQTGQVTNLEYTFRTKSGEEIIGLLSAERIEIGGQPYALTVIQDITERKRAEEKIRERESTLRAYYNNSSLMMGIVELTEEDDIIHIYDNPATCAFFGVESDSTAGLRASEIGAKPSVIARWAKHYRKSERLNRPVSFEYQHESGSETRWLSATVSCIGAAAGGGRPRFAYVAEDVTEKKLAQENLIKAERRAAEDYQALLQRIVPLGQTLGTARDLLTIYRAVHEFVCSSMKCSAFFVSSYDADNRLRIAEYAWGEGEEVDISHLPPMPLSPDGGPNSQAVFQKKTIITNNFWDAQKNRPHVVLQKNDINPQSSLVVPMLIKNEVVGTLEVQAHENEAFNREQAVALEMVANLTAVAIENVRLLEIEANARKEAEAANRAKDEFLSVLSHELRTPLNSMFGWTRMLKAGILDEAKTKQAIEVIERNVRLQNNLIEDMLDVSRIITGKMRIEKEETDFAAVVRVALETARPAAEQKKISLALHADAESYPLLGDEDRLQQVVSNLINNAVKFTPEGGAVVLNLSQTDDGTVLLKVSDTGIGIEPEMLSQIFDRFRQADSTTRRTHSGLGLGLTIVRHLTELHGGSVTAESEGLGKGSSFTVVLPLLQKAPTVSAAVAATIAKGNGFSLRGARILLVDDDVDAMLPLQIILESQEAEVSCAASVPEALEELTGGKFDLLVSDIGMPERDGYDLITAVRQMDESENRDIPAVALTAYASTQDKRRALMCGFQQHFAKPIDFEQFLATVGALIARAKETR